MDGSLISAERKINSVELNVRVPEIPRGKNVNSVNIQLILDTPNIVFGV